MTLLTHTNVPDVRRRCGFSLIELIVVISIVAIMVALGMSSYSSWLTRTQYEELELDLKRSISFARGAAIKHGGRVHLCGSSDSASCATSFTNGWIVFTDLDRNGEVDSTDSIIRVFDRQSQRIAILVENSADGTAIPGVTFNYKGYSEVPLTATLSRGNDVASFSMTRAGFSQ